MITNSGKTHIKRYMAGYVPAIAQSISLGIGGTAESASHTDMQFETIRVPIVLTLFDFVTNKLVFKASVPEDYAGVIHEVGIFSLDTDPVAGDFSSRVISTFDSQSEEWTDPATGLASVFTTPARVGSDSLRLSPAASGSAEASQSGVALDLSGFSGSDVFSFAYNIAGASSTAIDFIFRTDASNYYTFSMGGQAIGYYLTDRAKSTATVTGTPDWGNITEIKVRATAGGTPINVNVDAIRIRDTDTSNEDHVLVSREVLAAPVTKIAGQPQDIEFSMDVSIT